MQTEIIVAIISAVAVVTAALIAKNKSSDKKKWFSVILTDAGDKDHIANGRCIGFSIDGYIENMIKHPNSLFLIPINNKFDLNDSAPNSIHRDFIEFCKINNISINAIQSGLDKSLGVAPDDRDYPLGTVGISYFWYNGEEKPVLFFGNSQKDPNSNNTFINASNCTPYDFWKSLTNSGIITNRKCLLLPLLGTGYAGPLTGSTSIMSSINGYFSFYNSSRINSIIFSIPEKKYKSEKMDLKFFEAVIKKGYL